MVNDTHAEPVRRTVAAVCRFCRLSLDPPSARRYMDWLYHERCWDKLVAASRSTGGTL